jgi:hypothetical protein
MRDQIAEAQRIAGQEGKVIGKDDIDLDALAARMLSLQKAQESQGS